MGVEIEAESFSGEDHRRFVERCRQGLLALGRMLERPGFGAGPPSIGLELEIGLVDGDARPAPVNHAVVAAAADPRVELELDRFNLEIGSEPASLVGRPLAATSRDLQRALAGIERAAAHLGARPVAVGILPTLTTADLGAAAMSDSPRFRALGGGLRALRGGPFHIDIDGDEPLRMSWDDLTLEGAATGLHVHLRMPPSAFAAAFNAAQAAVAPVLAASTNSPVLLEHLLWHETRVALFGQAVDDRAPVGGARLPSRASFGHGWIAGPLEPFAESVALHVPILPVVSDEDPAAVLAAGGTPRLHELRMHHGTVWRWNRAVFAPGDDAHLRIEMRALPAGPSAIDMRANVALLVGLTLALAPQMGWMARSLPFEFARRNFYAAARQGLAAVLLWPSADAPSPRPWPAAELIARLIPVARVGLTSCGVDADEVDELLAVVAERVACGVTGSVWQRRALAALEPGRSRTAALAAMTEAYIERAAGREPVHRWSLPTSGAPATVSEPRVLFVGVDWSGAGPPAAQKKAIWTAVVRDGVLCDLTDGLTRAEVTEHLITLAQTAPRIVAGLDFAFSLPGWWVREKGFTAVEGVWEWAAAEAAGDPRGWLKQLPEPFWGTNFRLRPTHSFDAERDEFRHTEHESTAPGARPMSTFRLFGPGTVGAQGLRGHPCLLALRQGGFAVWPFEPHADLLVVEVFPRLLVRQLSPSLSTLSGDALRAAFVDAAPAGFTGATGSYATVLRSNQDAFDAAASAWALWLGRGGLPDLAATEPESVYRLEGRIWSMPPGTAAPL